MTRTHQALGLVIALALCLGAAALGGLATAPRIDTWYATLAKPPWNPPSWVFGPVWTVLYVLMAIAVWLVWRREGWAGAPRALALFTTQLALNVAWSWVFFGARQPGWAFVELIVLWLAIGATAWAFWPHSRTAACLLLPYWAWVSFAGVLNFAIWRLNAV